MSVGVIPGLGLEQIEIVDLDPLHEPLRHETAPLGHLEHDPQIALRRSTDLDAATLRVEGEPSSESGVDLCHCVADGRRHRVPGLPDLEILGTAIEHVHRRTVRSSAVSSPEPGGLLPQERA
jgi:hypothetical protein